LPRDAAGKGPLGRPSVTDELYVDLLNSIVGGEFPANSRLPTELVLSQRYGVSRTTVRSALAMLKDEGYIVSRQGSGSTVVDRPMGAVKPFAPVESLADLEKCFEARISLEGEIAYHAALRRSDEELRDFDAHIEEMERIISEGEYHTAEDTEFHLMLAAACGNYFFESIMVSIRPHILFGMNISKTLGDESYRRHAIQSFDEHQTLVNAIRIRDAEAARQAMRDHLERSRARIFEGK
jgi:GntR family transcriptional regulator, transcriptional repressor for pyruvate dehydrogenase complex